MGTEFWVWLTVLIVIVVGILVMANQPATPEAVAAAEQARAQLVCPHCQMKGNVTHRREARKAGISGGKATAAILTGGVSLLGTGLSRKTTVTVAHCANCNTEWSF